jgi:polar amino acid transport system substrate-binding protein
MLSRLKHTLLFVMLTAFLGGFAGSAAAADSPVLDRVVDKRVLRVGMSGSQPPFNVKSRSGSLIGIEVDLATAIAAGLRVELEIVQKPFGELLGELDAGRVDMVMSGMAVTPERAQNVSFVGPYLMSGKSILTKSSTLAAVGDTGEINSADVTLAALSNSTSEMFAKRALPEAKLVAVSDYDEAIKLLTEDKVDAVVADMPICALSIMRFPDAGFATLKQPFTYEPIGIAVPSNDPQFLNLIDNFVDAMEATGALERVRQNWLNNNSWIAALP